MYSNYYKSLLKFSNLFFFCISLIIIAYLNMRPNSTSAASLAYVTNTANSTVSSCSITDGVFTNCDTFEGFSQLGGIAITSDGAGAYVTSQGAGSGTLVYYCSLNSKSGSFDKCIIAGREFQGPLGIVLTADDIGAYITNSNGGSVSYCNINKTTKLFENCILAAENIETPFGIALNTTKTEIYITQFLQNVVSHCNIVPDTHSLTRCEHTGGNFNIPFGITLTSKGAYISNYGAGSGKEDGTISYCNINTTNGLLENCHIATSTGFKAPTGLLVNEKEKKVYISSFLDNNITVCQINSSDDLPSCQIAASAIDDPYGLSGMGLLSKPNGDLAIYVTNLHTSNVSYCAVQVDSNLKCHIAGSGLNVPTGIVLSHKGDGVYITNDVSGVISYCRIDKTTKKLQSPCQVAASGFESLDGIVLTSDGRAAYVSGDQKQSILQSQKSIKDKNVFLSKVSSSPNKKKVMAQPNKISYCQISKKKFNCQSIASSSFNGTMGISLTSDNKFVYITNFGQNGEGSTISVCNINSSKKLKTMDACQIAGSGFNAPMGITITNDNKGAYIANGASGIISHCKIADSGFLENCEQISNNIFDIPTSITIDSQSKYAYIANEDNGEGRLISYCPILDDGLLGHCQTAGENFSGPWGIALTID